MPMPHRPENRSVCRVAALGGVLWCSWLVAGCGGDTASADAAPKTATMAREAAATAAITAATIPQTNAASCEYAAVNTAVGLAQLAGASGVVNIPAGICDWGDKQLDIKAGIALKGAGVDQTVIRRTLPVNRYVYLVHYLCGNGLRADFSGITLAGSGLATSLDTGLGLTGGCKDFTVAHSKFTNFSFAGVELSGSKYNTQQQGVIYDNDFLNNFNPAQSSYGYGIAVYGAYSDATWPALDIGSEHAVFVEDNRMTGNRHQLAGNNGARYVFRYNKATANDATRYYAQVDAHGLQGGNAKHGTRSFEIYENAFSTDIKTVSAYNVAAIGIRGGEGVIGHNTYTGKFAHPIQLQVEFGTCPTTTGTTGTPTPIPDQVHDVHIEADAAYPTGLVYIPTNDCSTTYVQAGRDYFIEPAPYAFKRYWYPHPLRASNP